MIRNILFMIIGAVIGAGVVYVEPSTCNAIINQAQSLADSAQGWIANR